jgi:hypothetical protein
MPIFEEWQDGTATDIAALRALWSDLNELESDLAPMEAERARVREQISVIVAHSGPVVLPGFGKALITNASVSFSYDTKQLDSLMADLVQTHPDIAAQIASARKQSQRTGGLRIEREKPGKER